MNDLLFYPAILVSSFILTFIVRKVAIRNSILDLPNERSSHSSPVPRGGGIAVVTVLFAGLIFLYFSRLIDRKIFFALLAGLPLSVMGLLDDLFHLKPGPRFLVQIICSSIALFILGGLQQISVFALNISSAYILYPVALIAIVWSANLFNFLDGIDGYLTSEIIFIGIAIFSLTGDKIGLLLSLTSLGFLYWNWQKAKIFMGDVGSTILGYTVAVLAIYHQNNNSSSIVVWLILSSVFWFDATITIYRRIRNREHISQAHKKHAYQRIVQAGFSHQKTVLFAVLLNVIGYILAFLSLHFQKYDWSFLVADLIILYLAVKAIDRKYPFLKT
jgi:UDP-N-acetylmuramyl pentapeptide phosphotransferase/UDP-N-acetylglucosamine-1-phosphate transferase